MPKLIHKLISRLCHQFLALMSLSRLIQPVPRLLGVRAKAHSFRSIHNHGFILVFSQNWFTVFVVQFVLHLLTGMKYIFRRRKKKIIFNRSQFSSRKNLTETKTKFYSEHNMHSCIALGVVIYIFFFFCFYHFYYYFVMTFITSYFGVVIHGVCVCVYLKKMCIAPPIRIQQIKLYFSIRR